MTVVIVMRDEEKIGEENLGRKGEWQRKREGHVKWWWLLEW